MKRLFLILLSTLLLTNLFAQNEETTIAGIIKKGDMTELSAHLAEQVDMSILGSEAMYSRSQAEMVLSRFFRDDSPTDFVIQHIGRSREDSSYVIGKLTTSTKSYRLTFLMSESREESRITQLRIEASH